MDLGIHHLHAAAAASLLACWAAAAAAFLVRKRPPRVREVRRAQAWKLGLLLQAAGVAAVFGMGRGALPAAAELPLAVAALGLGCGGVWTLAAAERALGRQFAYQARLVEGHQLITQGPYGVVRHPMYAAVFALGLGTALVWSRWTALPPFVLLYAAGTLVRIRAEERLLREAFGADFEAYAHRVPALLPRWR